MAYVYDGDNIIEEYPMGRGAGASTRYTYGPGIDEPLVVVRGRQALYYQADGLGTVTSLSGPGGVLRGTYSYDSFGVPKSSTDRTNWFRYTARQLDPETGLYYYRARYYDPSIGRFLSEDPVGFAGGMDFYSYAGNSPSNLTDPSGFEPTCADKKRCPSPGRQALYKALLHTLLPDLRVAEMIPMLGNGGVVQVGIGGSAVLGFKDIMPVGLAYSGSVSLAFDKYGDTALVLSGAGVGTGLGIGAIGGVQFSTSPFADNVFQLGGRFTDIGAGYAAGLGGALDYGFGSTPGGTIIETVGPGIGGIGRAFQFGGTLVIPLICH